MFRNCGNKTFRLKKSHPPLFKPKLFVELGMHLQMDSVALKIEGFFSLLIAASGGGEKIAYFCLGVHLFLKLFNAAGVRNVHLHCGNDQAAKSAWRQGVTKVHLPDVAPCTTL